MAERQTININEPVSDLPDWAIPFRNVGRQIIANPLPVVLGIVVVLLCLAAAGAIQLSRKAAAREAASKYAFALFEEDEAARLAALEAASTEPAPWGVEALYMVGEEAIARSEWDKARTAFETLVKDHANSPLAPRAAEGLAFIDESTGAIGQAIEGYRTVATRWPDSFAGRCQPYNLGRVLETAGNWRDAVAAYENQSVVFPESRIAAEAEVALDRLRVSHPELFDGGVADSTEVVDAAPEVSAPAESETIAVEEVPVPTETPASEPAAAAPEDETAPATAAEESVEVETSEQ